MTGKQQALVSPTYCDEVGSCDPSLQGAPKRIAEGIYVVSPVIA